MISVRTNVQCTTILLPEFPQNRIKTDLVQPPPLPEKQATKIQARFIYEKLKSNTYKYKLIHVPCSKTGHSIQSNNCTIIRYNNIKTCGSPPTCFGLFRTSSRMYLTKKAITIVTSSNITDVQYSSKNINTTVVKKFKQHCTECNS
jgi:hypothetical protein